MLFWCIAHKEDKRNKELAVNSYGIVQRPGKQRMCKQGLKNSQIDRKFALSTFCSVFGNTISVTHNIVNYGTKWTSFAGKKASTTYYVESSDQAK